jgi:hypothetical protein
MAATLNPEQEMEIVERRVYTRRREYIGIDDVETGGGKVEEHIGGRLHRIIVKTGSRTKAVIIAEQINLAISNFIKDNQLNSR